MKKLNKKMIIGIAIAVVLVIGIVITIILLNKKDDVPQKKETKKQEPLVENKINIVDINSKSRPFAIMINNISTARPVQSGLQDAYIIYEIITEGGITRFLALFLDQDTGQIGTVRSARHYFIDYALENDAIYVHHGQSDQALEDFNKGVVDRIVVDTGKTGWRSNPLKLSSEHTLFTSIEKLNNGISNKRTERNKDLLLNYSNESIDLKAIANSKPANKIDIKYSSATTSNYEYDSEKKVYKRSVNSKEHIDFVTKEQYTFKNIIAYQVRNYNLNDGSGKGRQGLENIGSGNGYYISEGYAIPITWEKNDRTSQTVYKLENGEELSVNDGNTFIQIVPDNE